MPGSQSHPALILAAGRSRRMGFPKALLASDGRPLLGRMVEDLLQGGWGPLAVALSEPGLTEFVAATLPGVAVLINPEPDRGMISTLRLGLDWAGDRAAGLLAWPVDHPLVSRKTLQRIRDSAREDTPPYPPLNRMGEGEEKVIIPTFNGRRGHPTWWGVCAWSALRSTQADGGAREILPLLAGMIALVPVEDDAVRMNVNTPADAGRFGLARHPL